MSNDPREPFAAGPDPEDRGPQRPRRRDWGDEGKPPPKKGGSTGLILAIVGGVLLLVCAGCGGVGFFAWLKVQEAADRVVRQNDLKEIGVAYHEHLDRERRPPENAAELQKTMQRLGTDPKVTARLTDGSVVFLGYGVRPTDMTEGTFKTVLAYEKDVPEKGGNILMGDNSIEYVTAAEFATKVKAKPKAGQSDQAKIDVTKVRIKSIETAVMKFQLDNGGQVAALDQLAHVGPQGQKPLLRPEDLVDAWGQPIIIDPTQTDKAGRPLIYSQGPPGGKQIRNWI
jgi:hypothetical protein